MNEEYVNLCMRCGKERIVSHVSKEKVGISTVVTTFTICPDRACQIKVNAENKKHEDKRKAMILRSAQRQHHSHRAKTPVKAVVKVKKRKKSN